MMGTSLRSRAKKSPDSQTGPTTSTARALPCTGADGYDVVVSLVERGADEIVHGRIGNDEGFFAVALDDEHAGKERTGLGHKEPAGLDEQAAFKAGKALKNGGGVFSHFGCCSKGPP